jgi:hypothetical protein
VQEYDGPWAGGAAAPVLDQRGIVDEVAKIVSGVVGDAKVFVLITRPEDDIVSLIHVTPPSS